MARPSTSSGTASSGGGGILAAASPDSSLYALHVPPTSAPAVSGKVRLSVRIYDASGSGSLKQTLTASVDSSGDDDDGGDGSGSGGARVLSVAFSPSARYLCASLSNHSVLVWDLRRGVVSHSISVASSSGGGGKKKSSRGGAQRLHGVTCGGSTDGSELVYTLTSSAEGGKLYLLEHDLDSGKLRRKIRCGSLDDDVAAAALGAACSPDGKILAVRNANEIRVIDSKTGDKTAKCKIRESGSLSSSVLAFSDDSALLSAAVPSGLALFSAHDGKEVCSLKCDEAVGSAALFLRGSGAGVAVTAEPGAGCVRIYSLGSVLSSPKKSKKKRGEVLRPTSTIKCIGALANMGVVCASFGRVRPGEVVSALLVPDARSSGTTRTVEVAYRDGDDLKSGDIPIGAEEKAQEGDGEDDKGRKRKSEERTLDAPGNVILGPGEGGGEALGASDRPASKKVKALDDDDDEDDGDDFQLPDDDDEDDAGEGGGRTIAERLAALSSQMDTLSDTDEDSDADEAGPMSTAKASPKAATSDSLSILLTQALRSNDDARLEVALRVTDSRVVRSSVQGLMNTDSADADDNDASSSSGDLIVTLLSKLVSRLARTPSRATELAVWVRAVLSALATGGAGGGGMGKRERDVALSRLLPLRNLLNERVGCLPELMRLDGRLALLDDEGR